MSVWAIADLHLSLGNPKKTMEVFPGWKNYQTEIKKHWEELIHQDDLVLIPGDISWAITMEEALVDLEWIHHLPGQKVIIRGNHDYWWPTVTKLRTFLPPTIHFIQNTAFHWHDVSIGGARLWDNSKEYSFHSVIEFVENPYAAKKTPEELAKQKEEEEGIFVRELKRLETSLKQVNPKARVKIALTHYPPIGPDLRPSRAAALLEDYKIDLCIFGHLHNVKENSHPFGEARGIKYIFASADYLRFTPIKILDQTGKIAY